MSSKRKSPLEIVQQQLSDLSEIVTEARGERWWPEVSINLRGSTLPNSWPPTQLRRLLNLAGDKEYNYAYTYLAQMFLMKHGVQIPTGVFLKNLAGPGTGRSPSKETRDFGIKAYRRQVELISALFPLEEATEDEWEDQIEKTKPSFRASQIAKELLPSQYKKGGKSRARAIKRVTDSIRTFKKSPPQIAVLPKIRTLISLGLFPPPGGSVERKNPGNQEASSNVDEKEAL